MKIELLQPLKEYKYIWSALLVDDQYIIEMNTTVMGSTNITLRTVGDYGLLLNWCAGPDAFNFLILLNCMLGYLEKDDLDLAPFCPRIRPATNDEAFMIMVLPYLDQIYYKNPRELLPKPEIRTCDAVDEKAQEGMKNVFRYEPRSSANS